MENTLRVRLTAVPDDGVLLMRGDEPRPRPARRGRIPVPGALPGLGYGVSAFYASPSDEVDALCGSRLMRFDQVAVFRRDDLERADLPHPGRDLVPSRARRAGGASPQLRPHEPAESVPCTGGRELTVTVPDDVDLRVDLNTEDDTGHPWAFRRDARDPALLREGAWLIVGSGKTRAVAQVAQIEGDLVWVRPLPGPVSQYRHLLADRGAA